MATSSEKFYEEISPTHVVSLMQKLQTTSRECDDFFFDYGPDREEGATTKLSNVRSKL